ncbi:MAG: PKD domain-containing protein, partial [Waddliaceae bacterium]
MKLKTLLSAFFILFSGISQPLFSAPTVEDLSPYFGPARSSSTSVTITGSGFWDINDDPIVTEVLFGDIPASSFTVVSDTQITVNTPLHVPGAVFVQVTVEDPMGVFESNVKRDDHMDHFVFQGFSFLNINMGGEGIAVIDTATNFTEPVNPLDPTSPDLSSIFSSPDGQYSISTRESTDNLPQVNIGPLTDTYPYETTFTNGETFKAITISLDGNTAYLLNESTPFNPSAIALDLKNQTYQTISLTEEVDEKLPVIPAISPTEPKLFAVYAVSNTPIIYVVNTDNYNDVEEILFAPSLGSPTAFALNSDGSKAVLVLDSGTIFIINTANYLDVSEVTVGGDPIGVVIASDNQAYVPCQGSASVFAIDLDGVESPVEIQMTDSFVPQSATCTPNGSKVFVGCRPPDGSDRDFVPLKVFQINTVNNYSLSSFNVGSLSDFNKEFDFIRGMVVNPNGVGGYFALANTADDRSNFYFFSVNAFPSSSVNPLPPGNYPNLSNRLLRQASTLTITPNQAPLSRLSISGEMPIRTGVTYTFDGTDSVSPTFNITDYEWVFSDESITVDPTANDGIKEVTFTEPGTYSVSLTVTNTLGVSTEQTFLVNSCINIDNKFNVTSLTNNGGETAALSMEIDVEQTPPSAPQNLIATPDRNENGYLVTLDWDAPETGSPDLYKIFRDDGVSNTEIGTSATLNYIDDTVVLGETYDYTVVAVQNDVDSVPSDPAIVTIDPIAPSAPQNLEGISSREPNGDYIVSLTWTAPETGAPDSYRIL